MDSTTEKKLNYLSETKNLIREAIAAQGVEISESDTFRSYAEKIESIGDADGGSELPVTKKMLLEELEAGGFTFVEAFGAYASAIANSFTLTLGEEYYVVWDGTEYKCTAQDLSIMGEGYEKAVGLGNLKQVGGTSNDEPFNIVWIPGATTVPLFSTTAEESHTVEIYQKIFGTYMIDGEFIASAGKNTIEHNWKAIPDYLYVFIQGSFPSIGNIFSATGFSQRILDQRTADKDGIGRIITAQDGVFTSVAHGVALEAESDTFSDAFGYIREVNYNTFSVGGTTWQLEDGAKYNYIAIFGL